MQEKTRILSTVSIYHAINDGAISAVPILFPIFKEIYQLNYTQVGVITGISLSVNLIAQLLIGNSADGRNSRTMLSLGILCISASLLFITQTTGFFSLLLFLMFLRFSASFFHPIGVGWISRTFKQYKLDWAMGVQSGFADLGAFIALSTTLLIAEIAGWSLPLYYWAAGGAASIIIAMILTKDIEENHLIVKKEKSTTAHNKIHGYISLLHKMKLLIPAFIISGAAWGMLSTYLPLLLAEKTTLSLSFIGYIAAIWLGIGCITSFFYGRIQTVIGRKNVLILSYFTIGISCILLFLYVNIPLFIAIMVLLGITVFLTYPALFSFISEITHESAEGGTFGATFTLQLGGGTILIFIGGFISDLFGIAYPFLILGIPALVLSGILFFYRKKAFTIRYL